MENIRVLDDSQTEAFDVDYMYEARWLKLKALIDRDFPDGRFSLLDVGGGNGNFADLVLHNYPEATAVVVDLSDPLLAKNKPNPRKKVMRGSATELAPIEGPVRHRVLQLAAASPGGRFVPPVAHQHRRHARAMPPVAEPAWAFVRLGESLRRHAARWRARLAHLLADLDAQHREVHARARRQYRGCRRVFPVEPAMAPPFRRHRALAFATSSTTASSRRRASLR